MITANDFIDIMKQEQGKSFCMGRVDNNHLEGRPRIIFDGESSPSAKRYPYLSSYVPKANDRVLLASISGTYVVLGKIQ
jgi:hypothetical protein